MEHTYSPGEFIFQCPVFWPFHTVHGVLKARILKFGLPFPSPVDHILSDLSTMTCQSWVWTVGQAVRVNDLLGGLCSAQSL